MFYIHLYEKLPNIRSVFLKFTKLCYFTCKGVRTWFYDMLFFTNFRSQCLTNHITPQSGNLVSPYHDNSGLSWTVSASVKGIVEPVERHGVLQTLIYAPVVRPKRCPTSSYPALLRSWTVVCPSSTLLMMLLLPDWPTVGLNRIRKKKNRFKTFITTDMPL